MSAHRPEKVRAWRALVEAWKRSGQTVNAFCRTRRLTRSNFDRWRRNLAADPVVSPPTPSPAFVPVRVVAEPMAEVVLRSGVVVRLPWCGCHWGRPMPSPDWSPRWGRRHTDPPAGRLRPTRRRVGGWFPFGDTHPSSDQLAAFPTPPNSSKPTRLASPDGALPAGHTPPDRATHRTVAFHRLARRPPQLFQCPAARRTGIPCVLLRVELINRVVRGGNAKYADVRIPGSPSSISTSPSCTVASRSPRCPGI